jgi:cell shape-determining protein MreD
LKIQGGVDTLRGVALATRPRTFLSSGAPPSLLSSLPVLFVSGWILLAYGEVYGPGLSAQAPFCVAVAAGVLFGSETGFWAGFLVGGAADLLSSLPLGSQAAVASLVGMAVGHLSAAVHRTSVVAPSTFLALGTLPYILLLSLLVRLGGAEPVGWTFTGTLGSTLRNLVAGLLVFLVASRFFPVRRGS